MDDRDETVDLDEFLQRPLFAFLATLSESGDPRVSPVWFCWEDGGIWFLGNTRDDSFPHRVKLHPRSAVAIEDFDERAGTVQHVGMRGTAMLCDFDRGRATRLLTRYLGPDEGQWDPRFGASLGDPENTLVRFDAETVVCRDVSYSAAPRM